MKQTPTRQPYQHTKLMCTTQAGLAIAFTAAPSARVKAHNSTLDKMEA